MKHNKTTNNHYSTYELPALRMSRITTIGDTDFVKERIEIEAKGRDIKEAVSGFEYLLQRQRCLKK